MSDAAVPLTSTVVKYSLQRQEHTTVLINMPTKIKKIKKDLFSCQHKPVKYDFVSMKMYLYARVM